LLQIKTVPEFFIQCTLKRGEHCFLVQFCTVTTLATFTVFVNWCTHWVVITKPTLSHLYDKKYYKTEASKCLAFNLQNQWSCSQSKYPCSQSCRTCFVRKWAQANNFQHCSLWLVFCHCMNLSNVPKNLQKYEMTTGFTMGNLSFLMFLQGR